MGTVRGDLHDTGKASSARWPRVPASRRRHRQAPQRSVAAGRQALASGRYRPLSLKADRPGKAERQAWLPTFPARLTQPLEFAPPK
jgi:hypothetical protein